MMSGTYRYPSFLSIHIIPQVLTFRSFIHFLIVEVLKRKKNRYITINDAVVDAVTLYLQNTPNVSLSDYMFVSESNRKAIKGDEQQFLSRMSIDRILKGAAKAVGLTSRMKQFVHNRILCSLITDTILQKSCRYADIENPRQTSFTLPPAVLCTGIDEPLIHLARLNIDRTQICFTFRCQHL